MSTAEEFLECSCLFSWFLKSLDNRFNCIAEEVRGKIGASIRKFLFLYSDLTINVFQRPPSAAIPLIDKSVARRSSQTTFGPQPLPSFWSPNNSCSRYIVCKHAAAWPAAAFPTSADIVLTGFMGKDWGLVYRGIVRCLCTINSIGNRFLRSRHIGVEIRKNGSRSWSWGCAREGKKRSSFLYFFFLFYNERPPSLMANRPLLLQPQQARDWGGESSVSVALTLPTSNSSESNSWRVCASIGA